MMMNSNTLSQQSLPYHFNFDRPLIHILHEGQLQLVARYSKFGKSANGTMVPLNTLVAAVSVNLATVLIRIKGSRPILTTVRSRLS
jgi:hypothetical protein